MCVHACVSVETLTAGMEYTRLRKEMPVCVCLRVCACVFVPPDGYIKRKRGKREKKERKVARIVNTSSRTLC